MKTLLVGTGGFIGSVLRYWFSAWVFRVLDKPWFPCGTLAVSLVGCHWPSRGLHHFFGVCIRNHHLLRDSRLLGAWLNIGLEVFFSLTAVLARRPIVSIILTVFSSFRHFQPPSFPYGGSARKYLEHWRHWVRLTILGGVS